MRNTLLSLLLIASALPAQAACYADYQAKKDNPLRLHYGVAEITALPCSSETAAVELAPRLEASGWTLLNVIGTFGPDGLETRKQDADAHYLRY